MGFINDDGMWTRDDPPDGGFFERSDFGSAKWKPIVRKSAVMYDLDDPNRMYYYVGLFTKEAVLAREMWERGTMSVTIRGKVWMTPTFDSFGHPAWESRMSDRSVEVWVAEVSDER